MVAEAAAHLGQVVQLQSKAGIVLRQNAVGHAGDIHVELFAVGQTGLFVHIQQIIHRIRDAAQQNCAAAADDKEQHQRKHQVQLDIDGGSHLHRADHLQIIRADVQVQLLAAGIDDLVVAFQLRLVVVDHAFHLGVLLACTAKIHVAEALQDLLLKLPVDLAGCDLLFQRYQFQHQTVVGGLCLIASTFQLDVIQDIVRGHHLAPVSKVVLQQIGVLVHILVGQAPQTVPLLGGDLFVLLCSFDGVGQIFLQHRAVPHLRAVEHIGVQRRDGVFFEVGIDIAQVCIGVAGAGGAKIRVVLPLAQQIVLHLVGIVFQNADALVVIVAIVQQTGRGVERELLLHIFFRIIGAVALDDGIQHIAGITRALLSIHHKAHLVGIREIGHLFALLQQCLVDGLLIFRDHRGHRDVGTDGAQPPGSTQCIHGLRDDGGGVNLVDVQFAAVRGVAVRDAVVGIADNDRCSVLLPTVCIQVDGGRTCQRHQKDQQAETLQIAQDLKLFHLRCLAFLRLRSWSSHALPSITATDSIRVFFRLRRCRKEAEP